MHFYFFIYYSERIALWHHQYVFAADNEHEIWMNFSPHIMCMPDNDCSTKIACIFCLQCILLQLHNFSFTTTNCMHLGILIVKNFSHIIDLNSLWIMSQYYEIYLSEMGFSVGTCTNTLSCNAHVGHKLRLTIGLIWLLFTGLEVQRALSCNQVFFVQPVTHSKWLHHFILNGFSQVFQATQWL